MSTPVAELEVPGQPVDRGPWAYVSPSRLNLWLKCPLAFKLRYIEGIETPTAPPQFVGQMVHRGLAGYYRQRQLGAPTDGEELIRTTLGQWQEAAAEGRVAFPTSDDETESQQTVERLLRAYLAQASSQEPRPLAVEAALSAPLKDPRTGEDFGLPLVGILDLVLDEAAGPRIVDFKTTARSTPPQEIVHEVQLSSYAWLWRQATGQNERAVEIRTLTKTRVPRIDALTFAARHDGHFERLFEVIRAYLDDLDRGRFVFRPGWACGSCEFLESHCRA